MSGWQCKPPVATACWSPCSTPRSCFLRQAHRFEWHAPLAGAGTYACPYIRRLHLLRILRKTCPLPCCPACNSSQSSTLDLARTWCLPAELPFALRAFNVHMAICRLFQQEDARGPAANDQETWVERLMQEVKENLKFRITSCPERLYVSDRLMDDALTRWSQYEDV